MGRRLELGGVPGALREGHGLNKWLAQTHKKNLADTSSFSFLMGTWPVSFEKSCLVLFVGDWSFSDAQRGSGLSVEVTGCYWLGSRPKNGVWNSGVTSLEDRVCEE